MHSTQMMEAQKVQKLMQSAQEEKIERLMEKSKLYSSKTAQAKMLRQTQIEEKEKLALSQLREREQKEAQIQQMQADQFSKRIIESKVEKELKLQEKRENALRLQRQKDYELMLKKIALDKQQEQIVEIKRQQQAMVERTVSDRMRANAIREAAVIKELDMGKMRKEFQEQQKL